MIMIFLALDPASRVKGFAIFADIFDGNNRRELKLLTYGTINCSDKAIPYGWRFVKLESDIEMLRSKYNFTEVACERGHWSSLVASINTIKDYCRRKKLPYYDYAPTTIKKKVTGRGDASKLDVARAVFKRFKVTGSDHETDAIAVGICHRGL